MKYRYDIKKGHYILNEATDNAPQEDQDQGQNNGKEDNLQANPQSYTLESDPEVMAIEQEKTNLKRTFDTEMSNLNNQKMTLEKSLMDKGTPGDPRLNPDMLELEKKIQDRKFRYEKELDVIEQKLLVYKKQKSGELEKSKSANESWRQGKYAPLNESNVHRAKVYIDGLFGENEPMKNFRDAKRYLSATDLIYGKDRVGVFVVCVDSDDLKVLNDVLETLGYDYDWVNRHIMPQVYGSRRDFIITEQK